MPDRMDYQSQNERNDNKIKKNFKLQKNKDRIL